MRNKHSHLLKSLLTSTVGAVLSVAPTAAEQVIFTEIQYNAKAGAPDFVELTNNTGTPLDMGEWYFSDGIEYTFPDFNAADSSAHILKQFETILVSPVDEDTLRTAYPNIPATTRIFGPYTGALSNSGETLTLNDKNGIVMTTIEYNDGGKWPPAADGTGHTLTRINPNLSNGGWRNWMSSATPGGTPGRTSADELPTITTQIAETSSVWKYDQNEANNDLGTAWRELDYDDNDWLEGPGPFGINTGDVFATPWTTKDRFTYYLRREFQFDAAFSSATLNLDAIVDDGLVVYLNGQEIYRFNMPTGEINFETPAEGGREWDDTDPVAEVDNADITAILRNGVNVLAVEVHNRTQGSSDIVFGADISIVTTEPPAGALPNLVISEIHFDQEGMIDWVELHAPGNSSISTAGLQLSPSRSFSDTVDLGALVPAGGYVSFPVNLPIDDNGDVDLFLIKGDAVIDAARLDRDLGEEGFQSYPVGQEWYGGMGHTRDAANDPSSRQTNIVINEIMYDAPSDQGTAEYIELYNRGAEAVDLSGWQISDGVRFDFPTGTSIAPAGISSLPRMPPASPKRMVDLPLLAIGVAACGTEANCSALKIKTATSSMKSTTCQGATGQILLVVTGAVWSCAILLWITASARHGLIAMRARSHRCRLSPTPPISYALLGCH